MRQAERSGLKFTRTEHGVLTLATGVGNGELNLAVWDVEQPSGPAIRSGGYRLAYQGLSAAECVGLASALGKSAHQVRVGHSGLNDTGATLVAHRHQRTGSPDQLADVCAQDNPTVFVYFAPARAIASSVPGVGAVAPRCKPVRQTQYAICPPGQVGSILQVRDGTCTGVDNTMTWTAWTTVDSTCAPSPEEPPKQTPVASADRCATMTTRRVVACPAGQTGHRVEESTQDTCAGTHTPWTQVPGPAGNTCQTPQAPCTPSAEGPLPFACPAGQGGQIWRTRYSTCSDTVGVAPQWPAWSDSHTVSNTCTTNCGASAGSFGTTCCTPIPETRVVACPAGSYGPGTPQIRFRGCVNATTQSTAWSAWQPYRDLEGNVTCRACPTEVLTETQQRWVERSGTCPSGQTGTIKWEAEQVRTRESYTYCPAGTTALPAPTLTEWTAWADTGARRNVVNACAASGSCYELTDYYSGTLDTSDAYYSVSYTANGVGGGCSATRRDDGISGATNCNPGANGVLDLGEWSRVANVGETYVRQGSQSGWGGGAHEFWGWDYEEFTLVNDSCKPTSPPTTCSVSAGTVFNWTVGGNSCSFTQPTATSLGVGQALAANDTTGPATGTANFSCNPGGYTADPSTYSSGLDTNCDPPSPRWPDTTEEAAANRFCSGMSAGSSGTVVWCPSPQVEASVHVVCGAGTPSIAMTPNAGATCQAPVSSPLTVSNVDVCVYNACGAAGNGVQTGPWYHIEMSPLNQAAYCSAKITLSENGDTQTFTFSLPTAYVPTQAWQTTNRETRNVAVGGQTHTLTFTQSYEPVSMSPPKTRCTLTLSP